MSAVAPGATPAISTSNLIDTFAQFGMTIAGRVLYLGLQVVLARALGPEGFGLYAIGWTVAGLLSTLTPVGMPQAVLRYQIGGRRSLTSSAMLITLVVGSGAGALLAAGANLIGTDIFGSPNAGPVIKAFATSIPLFGVFSLVSASLRTGGALIASAAVGAVLSLIYLGATVAVFVYAPNAVNAAHLYTVSIVLATIPAVVLLLHHPDMNAAPRVGALLHFGVITMLIHSANVLNLWVDRFAIGILGNAAAVGIYQVASQFAMIGLVLRTAVTIVFESGVARISSARKVPDLTREYFLACRLLLHISTPGLVVLAVAGEFWVTLLFGRSYEASALPLIILTIGQILVTLAGPSITALHMSGAERVVMIMTVGSVVLNILGNVALVPIMGSSGAALATTIANFAVAIGCLVLCVRSGRVRLSFPWLRDGLLATSVCLVATVVLVRLLGEMNILKALLVLVVAHAVYAATIALFCTVEDELLDKGRQLVAPRPSRKTTK